VAIAGQSPKIAWRPNPGGQVRTIEEAVAIARKHGVVIPEDVSFFVADAGELAANVTARGPVVRTEAGGYVQWSDFLNRFGKVPFQVNPKVLESDEAIVGVFAHELYELKRLRAIFKSGSKLTIESFGQHVQPGVAGNLHDLAWDVADKLVEKMRRVP
jgi:hypothetical protein